MVWPLWLEQTHNSRAAVFNLWNGPLEHVSAANQAGATAQVDAAINAQEPWSENFLNFAIEDLDLRLGAATPLVFKDKDPAIPLNVTPPFVHKNGLGLTVGDTQTKVRLKHLAVQYDYISSIGPSVKLVQLDLSTLGPSDRRAAAVIADTDRGWQEFSVDSTGRLSFCRTVSGQKVKKFYVIVANDAFGADQLLTGKYTIVAKKECAGRLFATSAGLGGQPTVLLDLFPWGAVGYTINDPFECPDGSGAVIGYATGSGTWAGSAFSGSGGGGLISTISGTIGGNTMTGSFTMGPDPFCQDTQAFRAKLVGTTRSAPGR